MIKKQTEANIKFEEISKEHKKLEDENNRLKNEIDDKKNEKIELRKKSRELSEKIQGKEKELTAVGGHKWQREFSAYVTAEAKHHAV